jgi:hypothetical protein
LGIPAPRPGQGSLNRTAFLSGQRSTEHLPLIKVPTVFTHGTADPFGSIDELRCRCGADPGGQRDRRSHRRPPRPGFQDARCAGLGGGRGATVAAVTGPVGRASR